MFEFSHTLTEWTSSTDGHGDTLIHEPTPLAKHQKYQDWFSWMIQMFCFFFPRTKKWQTPLNLNISHINAVFSCCSFVWHLPPLFILGSIPGASCFVPLSFSFHVFRLMSPSCFPTQVMLVGDSGVGKTCLLVRFKDGAFLAGSFISTVGIDFRVSLILIKQTKKTVKLHLIQSSLKRSSVWYLLLKQVICNGS